MSALEFYLSVFALSLSVYITLRVRNRLYGAKTPRLPLWGATLFVPTLLYLIFGLPYVTLAMFIALFYFTYVCSHQV